jgi:DNA-binding NarL/FixJ family response regulator
MLSTIPAPAPSATKPVRVLVVEGQALFGKALCQVLASDAEIEVVGDADSIANSPLRRLRPDLIVLDLDGHNQEFAEAMRTCRELAPQAKVCVLSTHVQPEVMQRCLSAGADGYVVKDILPVELIRAVKSVASGHAYVEQRDQREAPPLREDGQQPHQPHLREAQHHRAHAGRGPRDQDRAGVRAPWLRFT